jgi:hypothetical protein
MFALIIVFHESLGSLHIFANEDPTETFGTGGQSGQDYIPQFMAGGVSIENLAGLAGWEFQGKHCLFICVQYWNSLKRVINGEEDFIMLGFISH